MCTDSRCTQCSNGQTEAEAWADITRCIDRYGWMVQAVLDDGPRNPGFAYTAGLTLMDHPEIIVFGAHPDCAARSLNAIGEQVMLGREFDEGASLHGVFDDPETDATARLLDFPDSSSHLIIANTLFAHLYDDEPVPALQLVWPQTASLGPALSNRAARRREARQQRRRRSS